MWAYCAYLGQDDRIYFRIVTNITTIQDFFDRSSCFDLVRYAQRFLSHVKIYAML
eukprot:m.203599 g.203599  ORF g.203599 m.203599 type:complete len:55 (-) comp18854_c1_seq4:1514-1678(-)